MPPEHYAVVVGGAAIDVKARSAEPARLRTSNPGTVSRSLGGVGRNIAESISRLGSPVHLIATVGPDAIGDDLVARTAAAGVGVEQVIRSQHPTGSYLALLDCDGELVAAVSDLTATDSLELSDLAAATDLIASAAVVVLDANLPVRLAMWLLLAAEGARVVLEPVSVTKAGRLAPFLRPGLDVFTITPSVDELGALTDLPVESEDEIVAAATALRERGVANVWVSRGAAGSLFFAADGTITELPAVPTQVVDVTGAGDALTAGFVHGLLTGRSPIEAARVGHQVAALAVASPHTVRPDLGDAFRSATAQGADR